MEQASSAFSTGVPALAAIPQLAGNSRQGFGLVDGTMHWASGWVISSTVLGIKGSLYDGDAGSRSTGKERDTESGNDYFGGRYYASSMGRFMSPDPSGLVFASFANPQSLNLYSYAQNNPLIYSDPTGLDCAYLNNSGSGVESFDQHSSSGECGKTGGYWVDGGLTDAKINADKGTVQLTGTNDGTDVTHASYKDTSVYVDSWLNTSLNEAGHITMGLVGQQQVGQNPRSDAAFLSNMLVGGLKYNVVPGAIQPETPGQLRSFALIPVTGMQAQMIQNSINQSTAAPPNYSLNPALGLDCATWAQQVLKDAGIQTGPMQPYPNDLMKQLSNQFSVLPGHQ
jgi:RHS repeat-associated protein